jgi:N-acetylglucosamine-6-phosphate deacetylase
MSPLHHRQPGLAGAALDLPGITAEAIADGAHLHPAVVRLMWRARGARGMCLVSDAVDLGGADLGNARAPLTRGADGALRRDDGVLAGTGMGLDTAVRNAVSWGIPLADALTMASTTPARVLGRDDLGRLAEGAKADVVLLDADLSVHTVVVAGRIAYQAGARSEQ